jgi:signal transduction histidine kinase
LAAPLQNPGAVDDEAALDEHLAAVAYRYGGGAALFLAAFVGALWPTDWFVFRGLPEVQNAVGGLRLAVIAAAAASFALLNTTIGLRRPMLILGGAGSLILFAIGWFLARLGTPEQPWVHMAYPALFFSVLAPLRLPERALLVATLTVALCTGFLASFPLHFHTPLVGIVISFVVSMAAMVVAVGHLSFRIVRQSFYQSRALERATRELAETNETLEQRVRAQTQDLRRLADHLERAREEERTRIARELHDELGQQLTALNLSLALARQRCATDPQKVAGNLADLEALLSRTHGTVKQLVTELRPLPVDELGLQASIERLARQAQEHGQLRVRVAAADLEAVPPDIGAIAFRVVQEALTNVVRHSRARHAEVLTSVRDGELSLTVTDDGVGLPSPRPHGFGLLGIRERVAMLTGRFELRPRAGGGTALSVMLPLNRPKS